MQKINKKFILFTLLIVSSLAVSVNAQSEQELLLKKRVDLFYKYFADGNYEKMWQMSSKKHKEQNDNDKKGYIKTLRNFRGVELKTCIKNIKIESTKAIVTVEISMWMKEKLEWLSSSENNVWIFEDNNWFFESQIEK